MSCNEARKKSRELPLRRFLPPFFLFFISTVTPLVVFNRARRNCQNSFPIRGDALARREEGGKKESERSAPLIHAGARVIPRPRHILTSFRVTLCFSKMVGAHVAARRRRRGGWFISNIQSHPLSCVSAPSSPSPSTHILAARAEATARGRGRKQRWRRS